MNAHDNDLELDKAAGYDEPISVIEPIDEDREYEERADRDLSLAE